MKETLEKLIEIAEAKYDGHLTIFRWTTGWKAMLGTPDLYSGNGYKQIGDLPMFESLKDAITWATVMGAVKVKPGRRI